MAISDVQSALDTLRDEAHRFNRSVEGLCSAIDLLQLPRADEADAVAKLRALLPTLTGLEERAEDLDQQVNRQVPEGIAGRRGERTSRHCKSPAVSGG
jgi:hypothetical protein